MRASLQLVFMFVASSGARLGTGAVETVERDDGRQELYRAAFIRLKLDAPKP